MNEGVLTYDFQKDRFDVQYSCEEYRGGLHCGETFQAWHNGRWVPVRIEMKPDRTWYLVGLKNVDLMGLRVRI